ncbi:MAG: bifunctional protein-serine/threonine kinase/phosphatase [Pseudomonadales bacterium]|nr:bifunctional protein-serine/threonine kinase/phosphatase [Pseudomonadales bacterium]
MEHLKSGLQVSCAQISQAGVKEVNEDSIGIRIPEGGALTHKGIVAVIADGVSAAEAGQEASQACVQNLLYDYYCTPDTWTVPKSVLAVLNALNRWLYSQGSHLPDNQKGFVTTLSVVIFKSTTAHIFHIGDSRIYRYRDRQLEQLTTDHSKQVGKITYLARAMGLDTKIQMDYRKEEIKAGDKYILTTDGIHDFYKDSFWTTLLDSSTDMDQVAADMLQRALSAGSNDNLSCQILSIDGLAASNMDETYSNLSNLPFPPLLEKGQIIDGLKVESTLYESNRSQLYIVTDIETGEKSVMKTPSINFEDDPAYIERFIMESWLGRKLRHSKLVKIVVPRVEPTCLYYLMENVEGITLREWMDKTMNPSITSVVRITRQLAHALRAMHRQQVIHQDIKPSNIMIDEHDQIKIIDYGSCMMSSMAELPKPFEREIALGTASYSAPECHLGKKPDTRSDVFSLAVILFEMLTRKAPFSGKLDDLTKEADIKKLHYQSASEINAYVPSWFDLTLQKAMSINPDDRYYDVDEFLHDLEHPNPKLKKLAAKVPVMQRNPLRFWQTIAALQAVAILFLLVK